jgi:hypothetical protein
LIRLIHLFPLFLSVGDTSHNIDKKDISYTPCLTFFHLRICQSAAELLANIALDSSEVERGALTSESQQAVLVAFADSNIGGAAVHSLALSFATLKAMVAKLPTSPLPAASKFT